MRNRPRHRWRLLVFGIIAAAAVAGISAAIVAGQAIPGAGADPTPTLTVGELSTRQAGYQPTVAAFQRSVVDELVSKRVSVASAPRGEYEFLSQEPSYVDLDEALKRASSILTGRVEGQFLVYGKSALPDAPGVYLQSEIVADDGSMTLVVQDVAVTPLTDGTVRLGYRGCAHLLSTGESVAVLVEPSDVVPDGLRVIPGNAFVLDRGVLSIPCEDAESTAPLKGGSLAILMALFNTTKGQP